MVQVVPQLGAGRIKIDDADFPGGVVPVFGGAIGRKAVRYAFGARDDLKPSSAAGPPVAVVARVDVRRAVEIERVVGGIVLVCGEGRRADPMMMSLPHAQTPATSFSANASTFSAKHGDDGAVLETASTGP
jgi:hypothetical protein